MTQERFPDLVRQNCGHPVVEGEDEGERRRKRRRKVKELMEAQGDAGGDERTGGDIQEAEGSGGQDLTHKDSSEDEAADETWMRRRRMMTMRCQDELPSLDGKHVDDFEDEDERDVP